MKAFVLQQLVGPTLRRVGTMIGAYLVSVGASMDLASQIETAAIAAALFAVDLLSSASNRRGQ